MAWIAPMIVSVALRQSMIRDEEERKERQRKEEERQKKVDSYSEEMKRRKDLAP